LPNNNTVEKQHTWGGDMSMSAQHMLYRGVRRVLLGQALLSASVAGVCGYFSGIFALFSATYGGAVALLSTWWLARTIRSSTAAVSANPLGGAQLLYSGMVQRLLFAAGALAIGIGMLKLTALPLLIGFVVAQAGVLCVGGRS
jgi:F0F1-type ATP synthase assembly protein I